MAKLDASTVKNVVPHSLRGKITQDYCDRVVAMVADPEVGERYAENIITFANVLQEGRFKVADYFKAVMFVSHKIMGDTNISAYQKVFPDKVKRWLSKNLPQKDIQSYASAYNKTKLVTLLHEQTLIPDCIVYQGVRNKAISALAALLDSKNEHIIHKAADTLVRELRAPEKAQVKLDVQVNTGGYITELEDTLSRLAQSQSEKIINGECTAKDIAHTPITQSKKED